MPLYYPPSTNQLQKSLNANFVSGGTVITLNNTTGVQNKPGVCVVNRIDTDGQVLPASGRTYYAFTGTSGATLTGVSDVDGTDQDHAIGQVVEFVPDVVWAQALADALANLVNTTTLAIDTTKVVTPTAEQTLTNKTLTTPTITSPVIAAIPAGSRIASRVTSITSSATPTINTDNCDTVNITALAAAINTMSTNLSGTPVDKDLLEFEIKDDGTPRAITWGTSFVAGGADLPTTTVASKILTVLFQYSTANTLNKWRCIASVQES